MTPDERFAALFERTHQPLLAYAVRRVSDPADAADVVAETYLVAWRRLDDVPEGDAARPWLFGVARRVLANLYRGERRRGALADRLRESLADVLPEVDGPEPPVVAAMRGLPGPDQEILRLVAWEELARDEIALVLGVSRATVRVRLHRARRRLRERMERTEGLERLEPPAHETPAATPAETSAPAGGRLGAPSDVARRRTADGRRVLAAAARPETREA